MFGRKTKAKCKYYKESAAELRRDFYSYTDRIISILNDEKETDQVKVTDLKFLLEERECNVLRYDPMGMFLL